MVRWTSCWCLSHEKSIWLSASHCCLLMKGSGSKTTAGCEAPAKRAGEDRMMHVVVSCTRKLIEPRAWLFITSTESHSLNEQQRGSEHILVWHPKSTVSVLPNWWVLSRRMLSWAVCLSKHNFSCHRWHVLWVTPVQGTYPALHKIHCSLHPDL